MWLVGGSLPMTTSLVPHLPRAGFLGDRASGQAVEWKTLGFGIPLALSLTSISSQTESFGAIPSYPRQSISIMIKPVIVDGCYCEDK